MENTQITAQLVSENSDFLLLYDGTLCNPNGDPDQENKPRMDYDTDTNLVTDTRVKRYIRDFLKAEGNEIFVDMEGNSKVSPDSKLKAVINRYLSDEEFKATLFTGFPELEKTFDSIVKAKKETESIFKALQDKKNLELNIFILEYLVKNQFIDIRMFGSAFAVGGFTKAYTGAIQLNWGYSLHKVELVDSATIVTTMNDGSSTFGKDYRVYYSLLAFNGSINKYTAKYNGLTEADRKNFREAIWNSISAQPTRSKMNQYPQLYLEIVYNDGYSNGHFGDLRRYLKTSPKENVRSIDDVNLDVSALQTLISGNLGEGKAIKKVMVKGKYELQTNEKA
jgi:CRISPR-associated protein Csh2